MHICCHGNIHYIYHLILSELFAPLIVLHVRGNLSLLLEHAKSWKFRRFWYFDYTKTAKCPKDPFLRSAFIYRLMEGAARKAQDNKEETDGERIPRATWAMCNSRPPRKKHLEIRHRVYKKLVSKYSLRLKIKRNDWLLADTCPQAANHFALFWVWEWTQIL